MRTMAPWRRSESHHREARAVLSSTCSGGLKISSRTSVLEGSAHSAAAADRHVSIPEPT